MVHRSHLASSSLLALVLITAPASALARTIFVRADGLGPAPTIADAIDAAVDGDSIVLADGYYRGPGNRALEFYGKAITLRSDSRNPSVCVIDPEGATRAFYIRSGEGSDTIIEGIGIAGGGVTGSARGGGIACVDTSPTLRNCVITGCRSGSTGEGGGFYANGGSPVLEGCTISGNFGNRGGGIAAGGSNLLVERTVVSGNCATVVGDEIYRSSGGTLTLSCSAVPPDGISGSWIDAGGNIGDDPLFCDPRECTDAPVANGNYHLLEDSPCLPEGNPCGVLIGALGADCGIHGYGACCLTSGVCVEATATACGTNGGNYWGDGSDCDPSPCNDPGACCTPLGGCYVVTHSECVTEEGYWQGRGTDCTPNPCAAPANACFFVDFDTDGDPWTIESVGHGAVAEYRWVFQCPPVPPKGELFSIYVTPACCEYDLEGAVYGVHFDDLPDPDFDPIYVAEAVWNPLIEIGCQGFPFDCRFAGDAPFVPGERYFLGRGTVRANCGPQPGCTPPGNYFNAAFFPEFTTSCDPIPSHAELDCILPLGACCHADGACDLRTESECSAVDGEYQGADTACDPSPCEVSELPTDEATLRPSRLTLATPRPNPAAETCEFRFGLPASTRVELQVTDVAGRLVATPLRADLGAGYHEVSWHGRDGQGHPVPSGIYHIVLQTPERSLQARMIWLQ